MRRRRRRVRLQRYTRGPMPRVRLFALLVPLVGIACRHRPEEGRGASIASNGPSASLVAPPAASSSSPRSVDLAGRLWSAGPHAIELGELPIPSGEVVVVDAGVLQAPVRVAVPPGTYRVRVTRTDDRTVASAALVSPSAAVVRWEEVGAYPVDAGMSGFFDAGVFARVARTRWKNNIYDDLIAKWLEPAEKKLGRAGVLVPFENDAFSACSSGDGDGIYPVYVGRDSRGTVVAVVTDFRWPDE